MKYLILIFFIYLSSLGYINAEGKYKIDVRIKGVQDTSLILGYYHGNLKLIKDTIQLNSMGSGSFTGNEVLPQGVYFIYISDILFLDFIVAKDQHFSMEVNKDNPVESLKVKGNNLEKVFNDYKVFLTKQHRKSTVIQNKIKEKAELYPDSIETWKNGLKSLRSDVNLYIDNVLDMYPNTFLASFIQALVEIEVPLYKETNLPDSVIQIKRYQYYKQHYFDNMNLKDERLLRTPFFANKLNVFFEKTVLQIPDSVVKESVRVIDLAEGNKEMEKYLIQYTFNRANESKLMGMDAAMVALGEKYYLSGKADWVDSEFLTKLRERIIKLKPNLIGNQAPDLKMTGLNHQQYRLSEVYAPITVLIFWEPDCGHCKKEIPKLKQVVWDKYQDIGLKIFAVFTQYETEEWTKFVEEHQLEEWINVYDPYHQSDFRNKYDIYSTPVIYILDENKKIIAKRISAEQIPSFIDYKLKNN